MRIGMLVGNDLAELPWAAGLGLASVEWVRFEESPAAPPQADWHGFADTFAGEAQKAGLRISAIGAQYRNPLDPPQTEGSRQIFRRAIEVAARLGVKTVAGFAGAVLAHEHNPRGGNLVQKSFDQTLPQLLAFWEPLADYAADHGVRIAFEHCPQGPWHLPVAHYNALGQPAMWERFFHATSRANLGLEWDPSHLVCQYVDPVANLRKFGSRVFYVHAKDAHINRELLAAYGPCHPGVAEHRFPGFGDSNWAEIIHALLRAGYDSDLNIEGWHDPVLRDHVEEEAGPLAGQKLEEAGLRLALQHLRQFVPQE